MHRDGPGDGFPRIWIPKVKIAEARDTVSLGLRLEGWFFLEACNRYGHPRRRYERRQLITNIGLDHLMSDGSAFARLAVGIGTNPPSVEDTTLASQVANVGNPQVSFQLNPEPPPYYCTTTRVFEFPLGTFNNHNLTEIGLGKGAGALEASNRDLIRDDFGNPTTFPVAPDEILRAGHRFRVYIPGADQDIEDEIEIDNSGVHQITIRALSAGTSNAWRSSGALRVSSGTSQQDSGIAYETNVLAPITENSLSPTNLATNDGVTNATYTPGSYSGEWSMQWGLTRANWPTGVGAFVYALNGLNDAFVYRRHFQVAFEPKIQKFADSIQRILVINGRTSITRSD